jgi:type II secretory pathway component PulF
VTVSVSVALVEIEITGPHMYRSMLFTGEAGGTLVTVFCKLQKQILSMRNTAVYVTVLFLLRVCDHAGPCGLVLGTA